ncbi:CDP-alcohol phosphatidyltransferase family protein [Actinomadura parmotrematis]|uniref:CDP-alcohol phosphatidyltransferase family protein n=1 Tax=Actinomadura parmotrematis TaxID=2864039 RepID=A0ABS7FSV4_9ACTN|nr:CDP-alcohol phosphatidyltransferase family protein [Actinomadura parmotrematis]MBW8482814.1 CDP-alcohol phosphatidyltransferase family protein [Actinomadura parmotrematis]
MSGRVWTLPNALSFARLLGVPLFLWLVLAHHDWWALGVLVLAGLSDWLDGKLARALDQTSRLGTVLDPAADRLYILVTLIGLMVRGIIPVWLLVLLVAREFAILPIGPVMRRMGYRGPLPVHFVGKAATMSLLYAFPLLLLGDHSGAVATTAKVVGWSFAIWGTALYWWAALLYWEQARRLAAADRAGRAAPPPAPDPDPGPGGAPDHGPGAPPGAPKGAQTPR